jgi:hypothetical protein
MPESLQIRVLEGNRPTFTGPLTGAVELGRQQPGEPDACAWLPPAGSGPARLGQQTRTDTFKNR